MDAIAMLAVTVLIVCAILAGMHGGGDDDDRLDQSGPDGPGYW